MQLSKRIYALIPYGGTSLNESAIIRIFRFFKAQDTESTAGFKSHQHLHPSRLISLCLAISL